MIFGMTGRQCQTTIAAGKVLMQDRVLVNIDEEAENAHILEAAKKLWGDLNRPDVLRKNYHKEDIPCLRKCIPFRSSH